MMRSIILSCGLLSTLTDGMVQANAPPSRYAEGQVWAYHTRRQDQGSSLKIQRIEMDGPIDIYHISVVGVHFKRAGIAGTLPHLPVSETTLNESVTKRVLDDTPFPTTALHEGIAEWKRAKGGVFTLPLAQIVDIIDDQISRSNASAS